MRPGTLVSEGRFPPLSHSCCSSAAFRSWLTRSDSTKAAAVKDGKSVYEHSRFQAPNTSLVHLPLSNIQRIHSSSNEFMWKFNSSYEADLPAANLVHTARTIMFVGIENRIRHFKHFDRESTTWFAIKDHAGNKILRGLCNTHVQMAHLNTFISEDTEPQGSSRQNRMRVASNRTRIWNLNDALLAIAGTFWQGALAQKGVFSVPGCLVALCGNVNNDVRLNLIRFSYVRPFA